MYFGRGPNKHQDPFTIPDMYQTYKEEYEYDKVYNIDYKIFNKLIDEFYKRMMYQVLNHGATFRMPYRLGTLRVLKRKINYSHKLAIDWDTTNKAGKRVYHLNDHTAGFKFFFRWNKDNIIFKHKNLYRLVMTRSHKRMLAKLIKSGQDYYEINK